MPPPPPPAPPPMPSGNLPSRPPAGNRSALLSDITKGRSLKKVVTNDRSAPLVAKSLGGSGSSLPLSTAPPVPGQLKVNGSLSLPPVPEAKRLRSNVDESGQGIDRFSGSSGPPQLGALFSGNIPKLKKRIGGIDTGDTESSRASSQVSHQMAASRHLNGGPSRLISQNNIVSAPLAPSVNNMRNLSNYNTLRPVSSKGPPPPIGKKPPNSRTGLSKPLGFQVPTSISSAPPLTLPPPPPTAPRTPVHHVSRLIPSPPSQAITLSPNGGSQSLAVQAAIRAAEQSSPSASLPPPPISRPPPPAPNIMKHSSNSSIPKSYHEAQTSQIKDSKRNSEPSSRMIKNDSRWKFRDDSMLPKPREFLGLPKKYRAGRGSSIPLDLSLFE